MNERSIITGSIIGTCVFIVLLIGLILTIIFLRRRCKKKDTNQMETVEDGVSNLGLDDDGLVSSTNQRVPATSQTTESADDKGLDPGIERMLDDAYADARQFAKFPNMP